MSTVASPAHAHPGRALYSILRYWRAAGLQHLDVRGSEEVIEGPSPSEQMLTLRGDIIKAFESRSLFQPLGEVSADLMMVAASPNHTDADHIGPFKGEEEELMTRLLDRLELDPARVYQSSLVRWFPESGQHPSREEVESCLPWLKKEIEVLRPKVVVTLGSVPSMALLGVTTPITKLRGTFHDLGGIGLRATYHPSYLLKKPTAKKDVWSDMQAVLELLKTR